MVYRPGTTEADFDAMREVILEFAQHGPFDVNQVSGELLARRIVMNAGSYAAILQDVVDLGELRELPNEGGPKRYELAPE